MPLRRVAVLLVLASALSLSLAASAQQTLGRINGTVTNSQSALIREYDRCGNQQPDRRKATTFHAEQRRFLIAGPSPSAPTRFPFLMMVLIHRISPLFRYRQTVRQR